MEYTDYAEFITSARSIPEFFFNVAKKYPNSAAFFAPKTSESGEILWIPSSREESSNRVKKIAYFLASLSVKLGDRIAIISGTRSEWTEIDLAILSVGAVTVSIYPSLPASDIGFILCDSGADIIFCENQEQLDKIIEIQKSPVKLPARENIPESTCEFKSRSIICIEQVESSIQTVEFQKILETEGDYNFNLNLDRDSIASLVYTSGTTGPSKGVIQTHGNHLANVEQATRSGAFALGGSLFLFLPLAHSFARLINYLGVLTPVTLYYCGVANKKKSVVDLIQVAKEMSSSNTNVIPSVPRLFEKIKSTLESPKTGIAGILLQATLKSSSNKCNPLRWITTPIRKKIKKKIFGENFIHAISGGAKLPSSVAIFFKNLDITILEGYGLTETCVATNVNLPTKWKIGSVGPLFDKVEAKIADDGEILFKGPNITSGYWNRPVATKESWDQDGWFHTGDIGHLDKDGFLFITDRKKDLVVTAGGKKIPPQKVEQLLVANSLISHAIYHGDGKPFCIALVSINPEYKNIKDLDQKLEEIKDTVNSSLASFETIKKLILIPEELTIENGLLTPTLKVKRKDVINKYQYLIDKIYQ